MTCPYNTPILLVYTIILLLTVSITDVLSSSLPSRTTLRGKERVISHLPTSGTGARDIHVRIHPDWPPSVLPSNQMNTGNNSNDGLLWKVVLNDTISQGIGARCLDGTPSGYFYRPSPSGNSSRWIIFLQGGGLCVTPKDCDDRTKDMYGSSNYWPSNVTGEGILDPRPSANPDFYDDNIAWVPYCTGDLYSGQRTKANVVGFPHLYFAGHLTLQAVLTHLNTSGMTNATEVILSGDSAGGIGTFINADYVTASLPQAVVKAMPIAGWFISIHTWSGLPPIGDTFALPYTVYDAYVDPDCHKNHPTNPWACFLAYYTQEYVSTPLFVAEAQFDEQQMYTEDGLTKGLNSTKAQNYCTYFGQQMRAQLGPLLTSNTTIGLFSPSCLVHVIDWNVVLISNTTFQQAFGNWYFNRPGPTKLLDNCGDLPCTPMCQHFPLPATKEATMGPRHRQGGRDWQAIPRQ